MLRLLQVLSLLALLPTSHLLSSSSSSLVQSVSAAASPIDNAIKISNHVTYVNNHPYFVQGVAYSPIPIGNSPSGLPRGDYFTTDYAYLWKRDLPLIRAMGANTIRIYSWDQTADHTDFLDAVNNNGLKVVITHYVGDKTITDLSTEAGQQASIDKFVQNVAKYGDHPAILYWMFGNELNGSWQGFLTDLSVRGECGWTPTCVQYLPGAANFAVCDKGAACVYPLLFGWINDAAKAAKQVTSRPIMTGFADVDWIISNTPTVDKIMRYGSYLSDIDAYGMQLYRGDSFGDYFTQYEAEAGGKPLIITEYGIDAYNDPCGWQENQAVQPCNNRYGDGIGGASSTPYVTLGATKPAAFVGCQGVGGQDCKDPGEVMQNRTDVALAKELITHSAGNSGTGLVLGGFVMAWVDEYWKGEATQDQCVKTPCQGNNILQCLNDLAVKGAASIYAVNQAAGCTYKAHITCGNYNLTQQDLCGYWLAAAPDHYVNEEWFGLNAPSSCSAPALATFNSNTVQNYNLDVLTMRPVVQGLSDVWGGSISASDYATCDALRPCRDCAMKKSGSCAEECGLGSKTAVLNYGNLDGKGAVTYDDDGTVKNAAALIRPNAAIMAVAMTALSAVAALML